MHESRKCSKPPGHKGRCNVQKPINPFWESTNTYKFNERKRKLQLEQHSFEEKVKRKESELANRENLVLNTEVHLRNLLIEKDKSISELRSAFQKSESQVEELEKKSTVLIKELDQVKCMTSALGLDVKQFSKSKRESNSTSHAMISDPNSSTRYRRRKESEKALKFIHGGETGSFFGAWDYIAGNAPKELVTELFVGYRRGSQLKKIFNSAMNNYQMSPEALQKAIATKYQNHLSRRKFVLVCRTQSSYFNAASETWLPRNVNCMGIDLRLPKSVSNCAVDAFVKALDIGDITELPNVAGVSRTVTGLVLMILDLHLRVPHLCRKLVWYNGLENHFIMQFSDDGAPETSQLTMSIGSMTTWNLGERVRSSDFQYLLHCVSLHEKHEVLEQLWKQHTDEMAMLEGNIITIASRKCTIEFQPSADMCWQSWANNEINQAATYPSPYANVHSGNICTMGGTIGFASTDTWKPYTIADREKHASMLQNFEKSLQPGLSEKTRHEKKLQFMAENGIRGFGPPRIGVFADKQRPEPLHCEINAWQLVINIVYQESVQRNVFDQFIKVLGAPLTVSPTHKKVTEADEMPVLGCGLLFLVPFFQDHYKDDKKRFNKIPVRLIGEQAVAIARYGYRLVDSLQLPDESPAQEVKRLSLSRIVLYLRNACTTFNKVTTTKADLLELEDNCKLFFNLLCLFFPTHVNVTSWTIGYALPYHALKLFNTYEVGYGIISLQGKEAKHSAVKNDSELSNRSNKSGRNGKWWQVMRANYVRNVYLPEHQPLPQTYKSHFKSRIPPHCDSEGVCDCGRLQLADCNLCHTCLQCQEIVESAQNQKLTTHLIEIFKPYLCSECGQRFADQVDLQSHNKSHHGKVMASLWSGKNPREMSVCELQAELKNRSLGTSGKKEILIKRLESSLWVEKNTL